MQSQRDKRQREWYNNSTILWLKPSIVADIINAERRQVFTEIENCANAAEDRIAELGGPQNKMIELATWVFYLVIHSTYLLTLSQGNLSLSLSLSLSLKSNPIVIRVLMYTVIVACLLSYFVMFQNIVSFLKIKIISLLMFLLSSYFIFTTISKKT